MRPDNKTIHDFGEQWTKFTTNDGYYGCIDMLQDYFGTLLPIEKLEGKVVAEIGSGTGRIVNMLLDAKVLHVTAVEPSDAFYIMQQNTINRADSIQYVHATGEDFLKLSSVKKYDYIFSLGVLHHIENPLPTLLSAYSALKRGGRMVVWLYGKENNTLYLFLSKILRIITPFLPHFLLLFICCSLFPFLKLYIFLSKYCHIPMRKYMTCVLARLSNKALLLNIYDQLNPAYAKYYTRKEVVALLEQAGFVDIRIYHRHNYSWTAIGTKSIQKDEVNINE
jgi:SAM-dependent methyltransferase